MIAIRIRSVRAATALITTVGSATWPSGSSQSRWSQRKKPSQPASSAATARSTSSRGSPKGPTLGTPTSAARPPLRRQ